MVSTISDSELKKQLEKFGENVGPITRTTRDVWVRKLERLKKEKNQKQNYPSFSTKATLSGFSSDDSEADGSGSYMVGKNQRRRRSNSFLGRGEASKNNSFAQNEPSSITRSEFIFKKPDLFSLNRKENSAFPGYSKESILKPSIRRTLTRQNKQSLNTTFDVDSSDSDVDFSNKTERIPLWRKTRRLPDSQLNTPPLIYSTSTPNSDTENTGNSSTSISTLYDSRTDFCTDSKKQKTNQSLIGSSPSSIQANGYMSYHSSLNGEFRTEDDSSAASNYSQCVSWLLLAVVGIFFLVVGVLYVNARHGNPSGLMNRNYSAPLCNNYHINESCIEEKDLNRILLLSRRMHSIIAQAAGEYDCKIGKRLSRSLSVEELKFALKHQPNSLEILQNHKNLEKDVYKAILLIAENPSWGIRLHFLESIVPSPLHVRAFESETAIKPLFCRLQQALFRTATEISISILAVLGVYLLIRKMKNARKRKEEEQKEMYAMIEKIIGYLQQHNEACQSNPDLKPYVPILHVRDMFIPPSQRKSLQNVWDKAVAFLEENESRLRVEQQQISGEDFQVWRWLQSTPQEGASTRQGKVWQGQAFGSSGNGMNVLPFSPTPCLKIRNMFDPEVEYGDDWQVHVKDAILEKCEGNDGIVHIQVDTSSNEGCVYMKCNSPETAGAAYRALHGSWFDGKLVTVKYLRPERYHERFPESRYCFTSLKPSNNMRLSLSTPFHSSPLERS